MHPPWCASFQRGKHNAAGVLQASRRAYARWAGSVRVPMASAPRRPQPDPRPRVHSECSDADDYLAEVRAGLEVATGRGHGVEGNSIDHQRQRRALEALRKTIEVARAADENLVDADRSSVLLGDMAAPPPSSVATTARAARRAPSTSCARPSPPRVSGFSTAAI